MKLTSLFSLTSDLEKVVTGSLMVTVDERVCDWQGKNDCKSVCLDILADIQHGSSEQYKAEWGQFGIMFQRKCGDKSRVRNATFGTGSHFRRKWYSQGVTTCNNFIKILKMVTDTVFIFLNSW